MICPVDVNVCDVLALKTMKKLMPTTITASDMSGKRIIQWSIR
ncbi:MAG: hypothetical protein CM1200mP20_09400 [Pseudomonadota bacterium]|nr:MAG: hypothetical protein CM1200mP20_09400 [Pseudomonadota bacterium]